KLAMTYAALEGTLPHIEEDQLEAAIAVSLYARRCAAFLVELQTGQHTAQTELEIRYIKYVRSHSGSRIRLMQQQTWRYTRSAEKFQKTLENLRKANVIEIREGKVYYVAS